ncbi:PHP domain-containing protein [Aquihabitans daechungensis]|uniref:PHP domain-containing protein n=1 Tax=Aquihabitans daechungensis TaxID=1052257 RepID=UPI003B9ECA14
MDPLEALLRVAYLQDRGLLPSQKTAAFLKAADVVRALPEGELERRVSNNTLLELPSVGASTGEVIKQALAGKVPDRITKLEAETTIPLGEGAELRTAIKGDLHAHSTWSDGGASIETMARAAMALGHEYLVMTDHSPRLTVAHGLNRDRLLAQLDEIEALNEQLAPFRILTGIEVDILVDGALDQDQDLLERLDIVVASVHSKLAMEEKHMTERMLLAVASPHVDVLGHCTGRKVKGFGPDQVEIRKRSVFDAELIFAACAQFGTAVEINCRPERQDPPPELLDLALDAGCLISIDTDSHSPGHLEFVNYGCDKAVEHGIEAERIINTWPLDDLLAWTRTHVAA